MAKRAKPDNELHEIIARLSEVEQLPVAQQLALEKSLRKKQEELQLLQAKVNELGR